MGKNRDRHKNGFAGQNTDRKKGRSEGHTTERPPHRRQGPVTEPAADNDPVRLADQLRDQFTDRPESLVFKIRAGCVQMIQLLVYGLLCGTLVGAVASIFARGIDAATELRAAHPWVIFLMPVGAALIVFFYQKFDRSEGTQGVRASPARWRL